MRRFIRSAVVRVGRRGSFLIFLAILNILYGYSLVAIPRPGPVSVNLILPSAVWGIVWIISGVVCFLESFVTLDRLAFTVAVLVQFLWGAAELFSWLTSATNPYGWISAAIFLAFGLLTSIVSFWPEQRRFRVEDK